LLNFALLIQKKYLLLSKKSLLATFLLTTLYGLFDEIHQLFIPGRAFDWYDFVADVIGGFLGIVLVKIILYNYSINKNNF